MGKEPVLRLHWIKRNKLNNQKYNGKQQLQDFIG